VIPGGSKANLDYVQGKVRFAGELPGPLRWVLADAQTNGGLLASVPSVDSAGAMRALARVGVKAAVIGEVKRGSGIDVLP
jgi:selenide,water dikinase